MAKVTEFSVEAYSLDWHENLSACGPELTEGRFGHGVGLTTARFRLDVLNGERIR